MFGGWWKEKGMRHKVQSTLYRELYWICRSLPKCPIISASYIAQGMTGSTEFSFVNPDSCLLDMMGTKLLNCTLKKKIKKKSIFYAELLVQKTTTKLCLCGASFLSNPSPQRKQNKTNTWMFYVMPASKCTKNNNKRPWIFCVRWHSFLCKTNKQTKNPEYSMLCQLFVWKKTVFLH